MGWIDAPPVGMADRHFEWEDKIRQLLVLLFFFHLTCHVTSSQWRHSPPLNFIRFPSNILRAGPTFVLFPCRVVWSCVFIFLITREMVFFSFFYYLCCCCVSPALIICFIPEKMKTSLGRSILFAGPFGCPLGGAWQDDIVFPFLMDRYATQSKFFNLKSITKKQSRATDVKRWKEFEKDGEASRNIKRRFVC